MSDLPDSHLYQVDSKIKAVLPNLTVWWTTAYAYHPCVCTVTDLKHFVKRNITSSTWHDLTHNEGSLSAWIQGIKDEWQMLQDELAKEVG